MRISFMLYSIPTSPAKFYTKLSVTPLINRPSIMPHDLPPMQMIKVLCMRTIYLVVVFLISLPGKSQSVYNIKSLPLKRVEFVNGQALCGYYDAKTKKL